MGNSSQTRVTDNRPEPLALLAPGREVGPPVMCTNLSGQFIVPFLVREGKIDKMEPGPMTPRSVQDITQG